MSLWVKEPVVKYLANPQDPLMTKPELYELKGKVQPGPESDRIKTVDETEPAIPTAKGDFIADVNTPQFDRVNAYHFVQKTLNMYQEALGRKIPWAFRDDQLKLHPLAGVMMNAYYSRWDEEIKLFYFESKTYPKELCYTSKMADVITHETGHAVLDGLKPSYLGWGSHGGAIHEGFGDSTAMLVAMSNDTVIDKVLDKTSGDLKQENLIASLAEQFGKAVYGNKLYLRNAINDLKMSDFESGKESREEHSFGRLFAGMFYDMIVNVANDYSRLDHTKNAIKQTQKDLTKLLARALGDFAPSGSIYYKTVAKALLKSDLVDFNGKNQEIIAKVLVAREILTPSEINEWKDQQSSIPAIKLPTTSVGSEKAILSFLNDHTKDLGLPEGETFELNKMYTNTYGETFVHVNINKNIPIPDYDWLDKPEKLSINVKEGIVLGFDRNGELFHNTYNKLTQENFDDAIKDAEQALRNLQNNQNKGNKIPPTVYKESKDSDVLVKAPRFDDPIND